VLISNDTRREETPSRPVSSQFRRLLFLFKTRDVGHDATPPVEGCDLENRRRVLRRNPLGDPTSVDAEEAMDEATAGEAPAAWTGGKGFSGMATASTLIRGEAVRGGEVGRLAEVGVDAGGTVVAPVAAATGGAISGIVVVVVCVVGAALPDNDADVCCSLDAMGCDLLGFEKGVAVGLFPNDDEDASLPSLVFSSLPDLHLLKELSHDFLKPGDCSLLSFSRSDLNSGAEMVRERDRLGLPTEVLT
jgi:hypothetical protein